MVVLQAIERRVAAAPRTRARTAAAKKCRVPRPELRRSGVPRSGAPRRTRGWSRTSRTGARRRRCPDAARGSCRRATRARRGRRCPGRAQTSSTASRSTRAHEHREARRTARWSGGVEQVVAPGDGAPQRLLARRQVARSPRRAGTGRCSSAPASPRRRQQPDARGGQLDGERQAVEPVADLDHAARSSSVRSKSGITARARSRNSATASDCGARPTSRNRRRVGHRQRRHRVLLLAGDTQRLAARDQDPSPGAAASSSRDQRRGAHHLLEVVEDEQQSRSREVLLEAPTGEAAPVGEPQALGDGRRDERRLGDRLQRHQPDAVREPARAPGRRPRARGASCRCRRVP